MTLSITGLIDGTITLTTGITPATDVQGQTNNKFFLTSALAGFTFPTGTPPATGTPLFTLSAITAPPVNLAANTNSGPLAVSGTQSTSVLTNNTLLGGYEAAGGGSFFIPIATSSSLELFGNGDNVGGFQAMTQKATATVTFTYDDGTVLTPEPATIAVLGLGMVALGAVRRRRQG
jgi:hypothetical protein